MGGPFYKWSGRDCEHQYLIFWTKLRCYDHFLKILLVKDFEKNWQLIQKIYNNCVLSNCAWFGKIGQKCAGTTKNFLEKPEFRPDRPNVLTEIKMEDFIFRQTRLFCGKNVRLLRNRQSQNETPRLHIRQCSGLLFPTSLCFDLRPEDSTVFSNALKRWRIHEKMSMYSPTVFFECIEAVKDSRKNEYVLSNGYKTFRNRSKCIHNIKLIIRL